MPCRKSGANTVQHRQHFDLLMSLQDPHVTSDTSGDGSRTHDEAQEVRDDGASVAHSHILDSLRRRYYRTLTTSNHAHDPSGSVEPSVSEINGSSLRRDVTRKAAHAMRATEKASRMPQQAKKPLNKAYKAVPSPSRRACHPGDQPHQANCE